MYDPIVTAIKSEVDSLKIKITPEMPGLPFTLLSIELILIIFILNIRAFL